MIYKVKTIPYFDKQLKRLAKKFPSLKHQFRRLIDNLEKNPVQVLPLEITVSKSVLQSLPKEKENQAEEEFLLVF